MFKQQNDLLNEAQQRNLLIKQKENSLSRNRNHLLGIKLVTNSMEQNKPNLHNQAYLANPKRPQTISRNSSIKGIQVLSSRQSSHERRQLATSRSHERQKQSRQIKSQTNISEFQQKQRSKQGSIERRDKSTSEMQDLCLLYQNKFKQALTKSNAVYQLQLDSLKEIIGSNEERINNLITTINYLADKQQKMVRIIQKLEERLQSISKYHEQCHEYTLRRMDNLQSIQLIMAEELQKQSVKAKLQHQNRFKYIELIMKDIFTTQRSIAKQQFSFAFEELNKFHVVINQIDLKVNLLGCLKNNVKNVELKQDAIKQHVKQLNINLKECRKRLQLSTSPAQEQNSLTQIQLKFKNQLLNLQSRIKQLEKCRYILQSQYQLRQQKAEKTICELSTLLHKHERELQAKRKEGEELSRYNLQIENKLIQSRLKENSLKIEVDSFHKYLQTSKREDHDLLCKEKDVFKEKFEEMFQKNEYLQGLNCKNKYLIIQKEKQIAALQQNLEERDSEIIRLISNTKLLAEKEQFITKATCQITRLNYQIQGLVKQCGQLKSILEQNARQIKQLQTENKRLQQHNLVFQKQNDELTMKLNAIDKDFKEEQLYSEHLQQENEELENNLNQYKKVFQSQSCLFRKTIETLQKENVQLKKALPIHSEKQYVPQAKIYQKNQSYQIQPFLQKHGIRKTSSQMSGKLIKLKNVLQKMQLRMPVTCEVDSCGYLKLYEEGTYLLDQQETVFQLCDEELQTAIKANIITLFQ